MCVGFSSAEGPVLLLNCAFNYVFKYVFVESENALVIMVAMSMSFPPMFGAL